MSFELGLKNTIQFEDDPSRKNVESIFLQDSSSVIADSSSRLNRLAKEAIRCVLPLLNSDGLQAMEKATSGANYKNIYFTNVNLQDHNLPIVIRTNKNYKQLLQKRDLAHDVIMENKFSRLVVPRSTIIDNGFLIEERLPALKGYPLAFMALYYKNSAAFEEAAIELSSFLSQILLGDIIGGTSNYFNEFWEEGALRYDNLLIYQDAEGKGKIGLIDLDKLGNKITFPTRAHFLKAASTAISYFPHQYEIIVERFNDKCTFSEEDLTHLQEKREESLQALEKGVGSQYAYLDGNQLTIDENKVAEKIKNLNLNDICEKLEKKLIENKKHGFIFGRDEPTLSKRRQLFLKKSLPRLLHFFEQAVDKQFENSKGLSEYEKIAKRNLSINEDHFNEEYNDYLNERGNEKRSSDEKRMEGWQTINQLTAILIENNIFGKGSKYNDFINETRLIF